MKKHCWLVTMTIFMTIALSAQEVSVLAKIPGSCLPGDSFTVELHIWKTGIEGFARLQQQLPAGFSAIVADAAGGDFTFDKQKASFIWLKIPDQDTITVSYTVTSGQGLSGTFAIGEGVFSYLSENKIQKHLIPPTSLTIEGQEPVIAEAETTEPRPEIAEADSELLEVIQEPEEVIPEPEEVVQEPQEVIPEPEEVIPEPEEVIQKPEEEIPELQEVIQKPEEEIPEPQEMVQEVITVVPEAESELGVVIKETVVTEPEIPDEIKETIAGQSEVPQTQIQPAKEEPPVNEPLPVHRDVPAKPDPEKDALPPAQVEKAVKEDIGPAVTKQQILFRVQCCALKQFKEAEHIRNYYQLKEEVHHEYIDGWYKYTYGTFATYEEAKRASRHFRQQHPEASFVVGYENGKRIDIRYAIEKSNPGKLITLFPSLQ